MRKTVSSKIEIKVAGCIATFADFMNFYEVGVIRCGTSKSLQIMAEKTLYFKQKDCSNRGNI